MSISISPLIGFTIRSAILSMKASMIRFAHNTYPSANSENSLLVSETLDNVPAHFALAVNGFPSTPGWDSFAYISNLAQAFNYDSLVEPQNIELVAFMNNIRRIGANGDPNGTRMGAQMGAQIAKNVIKVSKLDPKGTKKAKIILTKQRDKSHSYQFALMNIWGSGWTSEWTHGGSNLDTLWAHGAQFVPPEADLQDLAQAGT